MLTIFPASVCRCLKHCVTFIRQYNDLQIIISKLLREEKAKTCSLCFSQFPFNLTHAFVVSLKAPFPLMASLLSFTLQWQHRISSQQLDAVTKCSTEIIYTLCSNIPKEVALLAFSSERRCLLLLQMIYAWRAKVFLFLFQRQNQSPWKENYISLLSGNTLILLQWLREFKSKLISYPCLVIK